MKRIIPVIVILLLYSCGENPNRVKYDPYAISNNEIVSSTAFDIPFKTTPSNVKTIHVKLNDVEGTDAIFDTGCSGFLISLLEAQALAKQGTLTKYDERDPSYSSIADGSVILNAQYRIGEVSVTDVNGNVHSVGNVIATVVENPEANVLVGNTIIDQLATTSYTIDLVNSIIHFQ